MRKSSVVLLALVVLAAIGVIFAVVQIRPAALPAPAPTPVRAPIFNPFVADPSFTPLTGTRAYSGQVGGAGYRIEVPQNWNGDLVLYAHGWHGGSALTVEDPPIRALLVQQGFAWGASSFALGGY